MTTLPERLRAETRAQHEQMEAGFGLPLTREEHARWCAMFLGFLEPLEARLAALLGDEHRFLSGRRKSGWLRQDLRALGWDEESVAALPRAEFLPVTDTAAQALGVMYVFEGATLGGQVIARHLETKLGFAGGEGYRYCASYGAEVGRRWQAFRGFLLEASGTEADQAVAAARDTFSRLQAWCEQWRVEPAAAARS
jgi:heme oxygenase